MAERSAEAEAWRDAVGSWRARTFAFLPELRVRTPEAAVEFVNWRGFIHFWPIKGVLLPSLWGAVAGDRPVASAHDDLGHVTWAWKDAALGQRRWYYAKVLRGKATLIALDILPCFYALSENYGDPELDYRQQYEDGLLSNEAKLIYEALLAAGPLDTVNLRRAIRMTSRTSDAPFDRALTELQRDFKILPIGVAETGAWRYSFIYELTHRHHPELVEAARPLSGKTARALLAQRYVDALGVATEGDVRRVFGWRPADVRSALAAQVAAGQLRQVGPEAYAVPALLATTGAPAAGTPTLPGASQ